MIQPAPYTQYINHDLIRALRESDPRGEDLQTFGDSIVIAVSAWMRAHSVAHMVDLIAREMYGAAAIDAVAFGETDASDEVRRATRAEVYAIASHVSSRVGVSSYGETMKALAREAINAVPRLSPVLSERSDPPVLPDGAWTPDCVQKLLTTNEWADALADAISDRGDPSTADVIRDKWGNLNTPEERVSRWYPPDPNPGEEVPLLNPPQWLTIACGAAKVLAEESLARRIMPPSPVTANEGWRKTAKPMDGITWSFGGHGVEVDGEKYNLSPRAGEAVARRKTAMSRSAPLLMPGVEASRPHQISLALDAPMTDRDLRELENRSGNIDLVLQANKAGFLSARASKIVIGNMSDPNINNGGQAEATVREWTKILKPGASRYQRRDYEGTIRAFREVDDLVIFTSDLRGGYRVMEVAGHIDPMVGDPIGPDDVIRIGYTKNFDQARRLAFESFGPKFKGYFLLNIDAIMRIDERSPATIRGYVRTAAMWDRAFAREDNADAGLRYGEFDPERMPALTPEEWARLINALSPAAVDWLNATRPKRRSMRGKAFRQATENDISAALKIADRLHDEKLAKLSYGTGKTLVIHPPDGYREAYRRLRDPKASKR